MAAESGYSLQDALNALWAAIAALNRRLDGVDTNLQEKIKLLEVSFIFFLGGKSKVLGTFYRSLKHFYLFRLNEFCTNICDFMGCVVKVSSVN